MQKIAYYVLAFPWMVIAKSAEFIVWDIITPPRRSKKTRWRRVNADTGYNLRSVKENAERREQPLREENEKLRNQLNRFHREQSLRGRKHN